MTNRRLDQLNRCQQPCFIPLLNWTVTCKAKPLFHIVNTMWTQTLKSGVYDTNQKGEKRSDDREAMSLAAREGWRDDTWQWPHPHNCYLNASHADWDRDLLLSLSWLPTIPDVWSVRPSILILMSIHSNQHNCYC